MRFKTALAGACLFVCQLAMAQQALNNDSIVKMAKAGLSDDVIISMVNTQPGSYTVTPDALLALSKQGVSDRVLSALMVAKPTAGTASSGSSAPTTVGADAKYDDLDIGVYHQVKGSWTEIPSESVNWKTGGVLKSVATQGIVKGDVNGRIGGPSSMTNMNTPVEFLIKTPDGVEGTDFQLIHLHEKKDAREFRTVTGGVFHASGGSSRDAVPFDQKKIAKRTYLVSMPNGLPVGQYAFLAPGLTGSSASGSTGKAYTFRLVE